MQFCQEWIIDLIIKQPFGNINFNSWIESYFNENHKCTNTFGSHCTYLYLYIYIANFMLIPFNVFPIHIDLLPNFSPLFEGRGKLVSVSCFKAYEFASLRHQLTQNVLSPLIIKRAKIVYIYIYICIYLRSREPL